MPRALLAVTLAIAILFSFFALPPAFAEEPEVIEGDEVLLIKRDAKGQIDQILTVRSNNIYGVTFKAAMLGLKKRDWLENGIGMWSTALPDCRVDISVAGDIIRLQCMMTAMSDSILVAGHCEVLDKNTGALSVGCVPETIDRLAESVRRAHQLLYGQRQQ